MTAEGKSPKQALLLIGLVSAAALLLEMVLVRWVAAEIRIFAYMHNLVLVACFLGFGLGCYRASQEPRWIRGLAALGAIALIVTDPFRLGIGEHVTQGIGAAEDSFVWGVQAQDMWARVGTIAVSVLAALAMVVLVALALEPFGQTLGALMNAHPRPIAAYSLNLVGSLAGTWGFFALSAAILGPTEWVAAAIALTLPFPLLSARGRLGIAVRVALLAAPIAIVLVADLLGKSPGKMTVWSPYQKLEVTPIFLPPAPARKGKLGETAGLLVRINNTLYQAALNLSREFRAKRPDIYQGRESLYDIPYRAVARPERVLVVGAGTGNDVAAALRGGAQAVDAVEIDPEILMLGLALHPERPYASPRVRAFAEDARTFFKRGEPGAYDVIWMGLLDSHTTASGYTTLRLDHYVYTRESFAEARRLLRPGGVIVCVFETQRAWIGDRIFALLRDTFDGVAPLSFRVPASPFLGWGGEVFYGGTRETLDRIRAAIAADPSFASFYGLHRTEHAGRTRVTDDDWPYLYLPGPGLPTAHLLVSLAILALCGGVFAWFRRQRAERVPEPYAGSFFFLGAAFLLLEVVGVSRAALLFGSTWTVTAVVVSGVLSMALFANGWVSWRRGGSLALPLAGILVCGAALVLVPLDRLAALGGALKVVVTGLFLGAPLFFSGLIFIRLFKDAPRKDMALAWNLFGAIVGGLSEQLSFVFGLRALTGVAIAFYIVAVALAWRAMRRRAAEARIAAGAEAPAPE